jgi:myo-inositol-1(or 4)-monophosphatase
MKEFEVAKKAVISASNIIKKYFKNVGYSLKGRANPVTIADLESEKVLRKEILKNFKNDSIISEEEKSIIKDKSRIWLIDPLDGTVNYAHSFPHFAISIGFIKDNQVLLGIVYDCIKEEFFWAVKGKGAYLNNIKIKVSSTKKLNSSLLATGFAYDRAEKSEFYCSFYSFFLKKSHDIRRCGAASLDICWTACGRIDGYWEFNLKPWDVAGGKIILEEAGGKITDFSNKPFEFGFEKIKLWGKEVLATNSKIHKEMYQTIKENLKYWRKKYGKIHR